MYIKKEAIDYKFFNCKKLYNVLNKSSKKSNVNTTVKKELFLTYRGLLRVLFVSQNNKTDHHFENLIKGAVKLRRFLFYLHDLKKIR